MGLFRLVLLLLLDSKMLVDGLVSQQASLLQQLLVLLVLLMLPLPLLGLSHAETNQRCERR
eukprot:747742-Hanusia_phi.AAC.1